MLRSGPSVARKTVVSKWFFVTVAIGTASFLVRSGWLLTAEADLPSAVKRHDSHTSASHPNTWKSEQFRPIRSLDRRKVIVRNKSARLHELAGLAPSITLQFLRALHCADAGDSAQA